MMWATTWSGAFIVLVTQKGWKVVGLFPPLSPSLLFLLSFLLSLPPFLPNQKASCGCYCPLMGWLDFLTRGNILYTLADRWIVTTISKKLHESLTSKPNVHIRHVSSLWTHIDKQFTTIHESKLDFTKIEKVNPVPLDSSDRILFCSELSNRSSIFDVLLV